MSFMFSLLRIFCLAMVSREIIRQGELLVHMRRGVDEMLLTLTCVAALFFGMTESLPKEIRIFLVAYFYGFGYLFPDFFPKRINSQEKNHEGDIP